MPQSRCLCVTEQWLLGQVPDTEPQELSKEVEELLEAKVHGNRRWHGYAVAWVVATLLLIG
eukprot:306611-Rhodomonas_salina.2